MRSSSGLIWAAPTGLPPRSVDLGKAVYTSFHDLCGRRVPLDVLYAELARQPLDLVLGVIARMGAAFIDPGQDAHHPRHQGRWLQDGIADDFPFSMPGASDMLAPGLVPYTGGRHLFVHEHGLAALTQLALQRCDATRVTEGLTRQHWMRVARLLLILNDHLEPCADHGDLASLAGIRRFGVSLLYHGQFGQFDQDMRKPILALARWRLLFDKYLPKHSGSAGQAFRHDTGVALESYWVAAALLMRATIGSATVVNADQSPWGLLVAIAQGAGRGRGDVNAILKQLTQSVEDFRTAVPSGTAFPELFEFERLQAKPLVLARPGEVIAPVPSILLRQLVLLPARVLSKTPAFQAALGKAFEDYAHDLVARIAGGDRQRWEPGKNCDHKTGEIDSLLWDSETAVVFEHKAGHLALSLGSWKAAMGALGPNDNAFETLGEASRPKDGGALTDPLWQFAASKTGVEEYLEKRYGNSPRELRPLVVTLEPFHVEEWLQRGYLEPLQRVGANTQTRAKWHAPEWLHIGELEALAELADAGRLDLLGLLGTKAARPGLRMDVLLTKLHGWVPVDRALAGRAAALDADALGLMADQGMTTTTSDRPPWWVSDAWTTDILLPPGVLRSDLDRALSAVREVFDLDWWTSVSTEHPLARILTSSATFSTLEVLELERDLAAVKAAEYGSDRLLAKLRHPEPREYKGARVEALTAGLLCGASLAFGIEEDGNGGGHDITVLTPRFAVEVTHCERRDEPAMRFFEGVSSELNSLLRGKHYDAILDGPDVELLAVVPTNYREARIDELVEDVRHRVQEALSVNRVPVRVEIPRVGHIDISEGRDGGQAQGPALNQNPFISKVVNVVIEKAEAQLPDDIPGVIMLQYPFGAVSDQALGAAIAGALDRKRDLSKLSGVVLFCQYFTGGGPERSLLVVNHEHARVPIDALPWPMQRRPSPSWG